MNPNQVRRGFNFSLQLIVALALIAPSFASAEVATPVEASIASQDVSSSASTKTTRIQATAKIESHAAEDAGLQGRIFGLGVEWQANHQLASDWEASLNVLTRFETGSFQSAYTDEFRPVTGLDLGEAAVRWHPNQNFSWKAGALDQAYYESPLFLASYSFPASLESARFDFKPFYLEIVAEQAIPTAQFSAIGPSITTGTPSLYIETLRAGFEKPKSWVAEGHFNYFSFGNLSSAVANQSRYGGNTVAGTGDNGSLFVYGYRGIEMGTKVRWEATRTLSLTAGGNYLLNLDAPTGLNAGRLGFVEAEVGLSPQTKLLPRFEIFQNEADSAPSLYTTRSLGHNNRQGVAGVLGMHLRKSDLYLESRFAAGNTIIDGPYQSNFTYFQFSLRKSYEVL